MVGNIQQGREKLKDIVVKEAEEEETENKKDQGEQTKDNINLTATESERKLRGAYRSFVISVTPKADI